MKIFCMLLLSTLLKLSHCWPNEIYGVQKVRGVNIGSWLVLEKWMVPSLFADVPASIKDEYNLVRYLGPTAAEKRLRAHWESWFTENDVIRLKASGINHLRIPIGYWAFSIKAGEPWVKGSWDFVLRACGWARKQKLKVMIDLHGAPGSQNGQDHSGQVGKANWYYSDENINRTVDVIGQIARVANATEWRDTITIIEVLNEPILWDDYEYRLGRLKDYYRRAFDRVRQYNNIAVVAFHDAFIEYKNWYYLRDDLHYWWVMLDTHLYYVFNNAWYNLTCDELVALPCKYVDSLQESNSKLWTVVGEWSLVLPKACNRQEYFGKQQLGVYEKSTGWFFWNFKVESDAGSEWSYFNSIRSGWINLQRENTATCPAQKTRTVSDRLDVSIKQMDLSNYFKI